MKTIIRKAKKLAKLLKTPSYRQPLTLGVAAAIEHESHLSSLNIATVVDVGANRGQFGLVARHIYPSAILYLFEPLPEAADVLEILFGTDRASTIFRNAIGDTTGTSTFNVASKDDSSSLLPVTSLQTELHPETATAKQVTVSVCRLDEILSERPFPRPAILKLDVQGFELSALRGCGTLLSKFDWIYTECSFQELYVGQALAHEIIRHLDENGFSLHGAFNISYDENHQSIDGDLLFRRRDRTPGVL